MKAAVDNTVKDVTKASTPEGAKQSLEDPEVLAQLKIKLAELSVEAQRIDAEQLEKFNTAANEDTKSARETLLELLNKPESLWVSITPSIISYMVIFGFFVILGVLMSGAIDPKTDDKVLQIIYVCVGAIASGFATVLNFWLGSSLGSRRKDGAVALSGTVDKVRELTDPSRPPPEPPGGGGRTPQGPAPSGGGVAASQRSTLPPALADAGRSTDPSTVNHRKDIPPGGGLPASFRYNNPGAQYPSREAARFGQLGYGIIGGGHKIACFPSPVNGAASNFDLLSRAYTGLSIGAAGQKWTGANGFGVPGYDPNLPLTRDMIDDPVRAIALLKAIAGRESGKGTNLSDEQWRLAHAMFKAGSADAFLQSYGVNTATAVATVRPDDAPGDQLEVLLMKALQKKGYRIDDAVGEINIVYVEGMNEDGSPNNDEANVFNDLRCVVGYKDGTPFMLGKWNATTEPGFYYDRDHPINRDGAARIKFGQYEAWKVGMHRGKQEALVQVGQVTVCRDLNRDMERTGDAEDTGTFGINQHGGYDMPVDDIGKASAGCLVGRTMTGHQQFMSIVKSDPRYLADPSFVFSTAILPAGDVLAST